MRLIAQAKMGFYPIAPEVTELILKHLRMPEVKPEGVTMLDPCCGEGAAIKQISEGLEIKPDRVYGVELDKVRAGKAQELLPVAHEKSHIVNASFLGMSITVHSQSLIYLNPPFDDEMGGGKREELRFVESATHRLAPSGVLCLVCPVNQVKGKSDMVNWLDVHFENIRVFRFPPEHRKFKEIVVFAVKRAVDLPEGSLYQFGELTKQEYKYSSHFGGYGNSDDTAFLAVLGTPFMKLSSTGAVQTIEDAIHVYELKACFAPHSFRKISFTDEELGEEIAKSDLNCLLDETKPVKPQRPPLPLGKGHVAQQLASGMLDGVVTTPEGSHVVRGTSRKESYVSERVCTEDPDTGATSEKVVTSERIVMTIRAVDSSGVIKTFTDAPPPSDADPDEDESGEGDEDTCINVKVSPAKAKAAQDVKRGELVAEAVAVSENKPAPRSWKLDVYVKSQGNGPGNPAGNSMRYANKADAEAAGRSLLSRWMAMDSYEVVPSDDEPNDKRS